MLHKFLLKRNALIMHQFRYAEVVNNFINKNNVKIHLQGIPYIHGDVDDCVDVDDIILMMM
jgi:hypothetical protein